MPPRIRILSDGKPGHVNQSIGLADALARRTNAAIDLVDITKLSFFESLVTAAATDAFPAPDAIISAGHATHLPLLWASRQHKAQTVLIMKPSLSVSLFDHVLVPTHDRIKGRHVISTEGSLNRISEDLPEKKDRGVILIGGESKHTDWEPQPLLDAIQQITTQKPQLSWVLTDSRRTPESFLSDVASLGLDIELHRHQDTGPDWVPKKLAYARSAWVTPDSSSMIYEALTANAQVGLLPLPMQDTKVTRGIRRLIREGRIATFEAPDAIATGSPAEFPPFHEAARCAEELIRRGIFSTKTA